MHTKWLFRECVTFAKDENGKLIYENTYQHAILKKEWETEKQTQKQRSFIQNTRTSNLFYLVVSGCILYEIYRVKIVPDTTL